MGEIIHLSDVQQIPPKSVNGIHLQQRYECMFDPNAPENKRWLWRVDFTRTYQYYGASPTLAGAQRSAERTINNLVQRRERDEENE